MLSGADSVTSDGFRSVKFIYEQGGFQALFFAFGIGPSVLCSTLYKKRSWGNEGQDFVLVEGHHRFVVVPTAAMYIQMGADFIVSPAMVEEVVPLCNRRGVPYSPGCGTVTEIIEAMELGCDLVKVFPAGTVGGPAFVKNVLAPLPWAMIMCTGAVEPTQENLSAWAKSGVTAVGMGSKLFPKEVIKAGDWSAISDLCRQSLSWFRAV